MGNNPQIALRLENCLPKVNNNHHLTNCLFYPVLVLAGHSSMVNYGPQQVMEAPPPPPPVIMQNTLQSGFNNVEQGSFVQTQQHNQQPNILQQQHLQTAIQVPTGQSNQNYLCSYFLTNDCERKFFPEVTKIHDLLCEDVKNHRLWL